MNPNKVFQRSIFVIVFIFIFSLFGREVSATINEVQEESPEVILNEVQEENLGGSLNEVQEENPEESLNETPTKEKMIIVNLSDIPTNFSEEINFLIGLKVIDGYPDQTFRPTKNVTREEAATMIGRALGLDGTLRKTSFPDVKAGTFGSGFIQSAVEKGIITGHTDGSFKPNDPMTRGQMAFLLQRAFEFSEKGNIYFKDVALTGSQYDAISMIAAAGLTNGFPDGTFKPLQNITREQFALFVARGKNDAFRVEVIPAHRITIDPGHGGKDPGAIGYNGLKEKELNLDIALKVEKLLKEKGIQVVMTRRDDTFITLENRVKIAVDSKSDTFVSIHGNSNTNTSANGTETFYSKNTSNAEESAELATYIQQRLYPALGTNNRGVNNKYNFHVNYKNPLPSVLIELGFISNKSDGSKLASDSYRTKAAEAITLGIQDYYNSQK